MLRLSLVICACVFGVLSPLAVAQEARDDGPPAQAERYYDALVRRPEPGYVFDRFCRAWLGAASSDSLEEYLTQRAEEGDAAEQLLLAFYMAREGRNVEAIERFRKTLAEHPEYASAWYEKARVEAATLDFETALSDLDHAAEAVGADNELALKVAKLRGRLLARTGRREEAWALWAAMIETYPDDELLAEDLVQLQADEGLIDEALVTLDGLIERTRDPLDRVARRLWSGELHIRANRRDAAVETFVGALVDTGAGTWLERELLARIERAYRSEDDLTALRDKLAELRDQEPQRLGVAQHLARVQAETGDIDGAVATWEAILARAPGDREIRTAYARMLWEAGQNDRAIVQLEALLERWPDDSSLRLRLAGLRAETGDRDGAVRDMRAYLNGAGTDVSVYVNAARTLQRLGVEDAAETIMREMVGHDPSDAARRFALAEFLFDTDKGGEAVAIWREVGAGSADGATVVLAGRALLNRGKAREALDVLGARAADFEGDTSYLALATEAAIAGREPERAIAWARSWAEAADDASAFENAVAAAGRAAKAAKAEQALADELSNLGAERTAAQACLLAEVYEQLGRYDDADRTLAAESDERAMRYRVRLLAGRGEHGRAADAMEALIERGSGRADAVRDLVTLLERAGRTSDALDWIGRWKELLPGATSPWLREAELHRSQGDQDAALACLERAYRQFPNDMTVASSLGAAYEDAGQVNDAERIYWDLYDAAESTATRVQWAGRLAEVAEWSGRTDHLVQTLNERREANRTSIVPLLALAEVHRVADRYEERREALIEASRVDPENIDLLLRLASVEQQEGDVDRAIATLRRAASADQTGRVRERIAEALVRDGRIEEALAELTTSDVAMDASGALRFVDALAAQEAWAESAALLAPFAAQSDDMQVWYAYGVVLEESERTHEACDAFMRVLECEQEPATGAAAPSAYLSMWRSYYEGVLPEEAFELIDQFESASMAYSHQGGGGYYAMMLGGSSQGTTVHLPGSVREGRSLALSHLGQLASEVDDHEREQLVADAEARGVALASLLLADGGFDAESWWDADVLAEHAEHDGVLALYVIYGSSWGGEGDPELLERAVERFGGQQSVLELAARLTLLETLEEEKVTEAWDDLVALIDGIDEPHPLAVYFMAAVLDGETLSIPLDDDRRDYLSRTVRSWYSESDRASPFQDQLFSTVLNMAAEQEDWEGVGELLEEEIAAHRGSGIVARASQAAQMMRMYGGMGGGQESIEPLGFPPSGLTGVPDSVIGAVGGGMYGDYGGIDAEETLLVLGDGADPMLVALLAGVSHDSERVAVALAELLDAPEPSLDAFMLAAGWAGEEGEPARAVSLLEQASYLPMSRPTRERIDRATVAYALETDLTGPVAESGRRAAMRLLYAARSPQARGALVGALEQLGLEDEAERERERLAAQPAQPRGGYYPGAPATSDIDRIREMIDDGRTDAAVRLAVRQLEQFGALALAGQYQMMQRWGEEDEAARLRRVIERAELAARVLEEADPGESANARQLASFGGVLEVYGEAERAEQAYARALELRYEAMPAARVILMRTEREAFDQAAAVLDLADERQSAEVGAQLQQVIAMSMGDGEEELFRLGELALCWLGMTEGVGERDASWIAGVVQGLANLRSVDGVEVPPLYANEREVDEDAVEADQRRNALHTRLVEAMLEVESISGSAFPHRLALAELEGDDLSELVDVARVAVGLDLDVSQLQQMVYSSYMFGMYGEDKVETIRLRSALEFLAERAAESPELAEEVHGMLDGRMRRERTAQFDGLRALYGAGEEAFAEAAEDYLGASVSPMTMMEDRLGTVVDILERRGLAPTLILDVVVEYVSDSDRASGMGFGMGDAALSGYVSAVIEHGGYDAGRRVVEALAEHLVGPADERAALIEQHYDPERGGSTRTANGRMHAFVEAITPLLQSERTIWIALEYYEPFDDPESSYQMQWASSVVSQAMMRTMEDEDAGPVLALLEHSPVIGELRRFRTYPVAWSEASIFSSFTMPTTPEVKKQMLGWLGEREPRTIGVVLLEGALREDPWAKRLEAMAPWSEALLEADAKVIEEIAQIVPPHRALPEGLSPEAHAVADRLYGFVGSKLDAEFAELMETTRIDSDEAWQIARRAGETLVSLCRADREADASALAEHLMPLMNRSSQRQGRSGYDARVMLAETLWQSAGGDAAATALGVWVFDQADAAQSPNALWSALSMVRWEAEPIDGGNEQAGKTCAMLRAIRDALPEGTDALLAAPDLAKVMAQFASDEDIASLSVWIEAAAASEPEEPFWREARGAVALSATLIKRDSEGDDSGGEPDAVAVIDGAELDGYLAAVAAREDAPASVRLRVVSMPLSEHAEQLPMASVAAPALAVQAMRDEPESIEADWVLPVAIQLAHAVQSDAGRRAEAIDFLDALLRAASRSAGLVGAPRAFTLGAPDYSTPNTLGIEALRLALAAGSPNHARRLLNNQDGALAQSIAAWAMLVEQGEVEQAVTVIDRYWDEAVVSYPDGITYSGAIDARLDEVLGAVSGDDARCMARIALGSLPDPDGPLEFADRAERVAGLVEVFRGHEFGDEKGRLATLAVLTSSEPGLELAGPDAIQAVANFDELTYDEAQDRWDRTTPEFEVLYAAARAAMRTGREQLIAGEILRLANYESGYWVWRVLESLQDIFSEEFMDRADAISLAEALEMTDLAGLIVYPREDWKRPARDEVFALHFLLRTLGEGEGGFDAWLEREEIEPDMQQLEVEIMSTLLGRLLADDLLTPDDRLARIRLVFGSEHVQRAFDDHDSVFEELHRPGALTSEQIAEHGVELAELLSDEAWMALAFGAAEADLGEMADDAWRRVMESKTSMDDRLHYIGHIMDSKRFALASAYLEGLEPATEELREKHAGLVRRANDGMEGRLHEDSDED